MKKPSKLEKEKYTIEVNYSDEAVEKKIMKFKTPSGDEFEISADEMATVLVGQLNSEQIDALFVESDRVNVVEVTRQIRCLAEKDFKKGDEIRVDYTHPYPIEFAIIEEVMKIAKINQDVPVFELTKEYVDKVRAQLKPEQKTFVEKFYAFFKGLKLKK